MLKQTITEQVSEASDEEGGERDHVTALELQVGDIERPTGEMDLLAASSGFLEPANDDFQFAPRPRLNPISKKKNKSMRPSGSLE